jgi:hypothetical protein
MTFAVGDPDGGVKAQASSDADLAGQAQAGHTSQGLLPRPRAEQPFCATAAIMLNDSQAAPIGGYARAVR